MTKTVTAKGNGFCPECGSALVIRSGSHGPFLGCCHYPTCQYISPLKAQTDGHIIKVLEGQECPKCQSTLVLRQGRYGMFIGCSQYPQCNHTEVIDKPDETSIACPQCDQGKLLQRKSRFGKVFYACNRYPDCQFSLNQQPIAGECAHCHYPLLMEKRTAQGVKRSCASRLCGKPVTTE
ncbi:NAD-dependent DNA ligase C4 zinc finger domain protein [Yersinia ruckeri]|uniref:DNA topoisomerase family protein n=1 Tax=Yersinia ruckeri TaxID=29486 RepID=UPI0005AD1FB7|nr:type I DNA topoisomerase [Yersinia ruckeri]AJI96576.1 NAD-dependent DNA ligase C4 zinc finger domain protein [Yersinia ruckeri]